MPPPHESTGRQADGPSSEQRFDHARGSTPDTRALTGDAAPRALATTMHTAWTSFAAKGDPGWDEWSDERPVMAFGTGDSEVVWAPREQERRLWG